MTKNTITTKIETAPEDEAQRELIGQPPHGHWMYSSSPPNFDLTRPLPPQFPIPSSHESIILQTSTTPVTISPAKTALVIIDMQNFFLSPALGRQADGLGNVAKKQLLETTLPAAVAAKIQVIWLNHWGLTQEDIDQMPPSLLRGFGAVQETSRSSAAINPDELHVFQRLFRGFGHDLGPITLEDGTVIQGGRMLMRDTWNTDLPPDLKKSFEAGHATDPPHVWAHKNRMSGLWYSTTPCGEFLKQKGICTLLFAGVNTDQCVGGTLQDAYSQGYDCIMLSDVCATTSPGYTKQCMEYNAAGSWGFLSDSQALKHGVDGMLKHNKES